MHVIATTRLALAAALALGTVSVADAQPGQRLQERVREQGTEAEQPGEQAGQWGQEEREAQAQGEQAKPLAREQQQKLQSHRAVAGTIVDVRDVTLQGDVPSKHKLIKLTANENTVIVDLGAMDPDDFARLGLSQGDEVMVIGETARINDKPVIFAQEIGRTLDFERETEPPRGTAGG